jgi:hypothetical protein
VDADAFGQNDATMGTGEKGVLNTVGANAQNADMTHILARADWTLELLYFWKRSTPLVHSPSIASSSRAQKLPVALFASLMVL